MIKARLQKRPQADKKIEVYDIILSHVYGTSVMSVIRLETQNAAHLERLTIELHAAGVKFS